MKRNFEQALLNWKDAKERKPLIVMGARQVGKTYILKEFGKQHFEQTVYLNFEEHEQANSFFQDTLEPQRIVKGLEFYFKTKITPRSTLIFFDEIQLSERALSSLKYFCEQAPEYFVCGAGSLLGIRGPKDRSFPVGKVNTLHMYPMSFFEFLDAIGEVHLRAYLENEWIESKVSDPFHNRFIEHLKRYYIVGGMPEVVKSYVTHQDFNRVRSIQKELLRNYELDFAKHAAPTEAPKIAALWNSISFQLARENKKFKYSGAVKNARAREYEDALIWLVNAHLVIKTNRLSAARLPLSGYAEPSVFKLYAFDVGLLGALAKLDSSILLEGHRLFSEFHGAFVENFVAQELIALFDNRDLYYWASEGIAEVDFVFQSQNQVVPLEVKAGENVRSRSLSVYAEKYHPQKMIRLSLKNFERQDSLICLPLYALPCLKSIH